MPPAVVPNEDNVSYIETCIVDCNSACELAEHTMPLLDLRDWHKSPKYMQSLLFEACEKLKEAVLTLAGVEIGFADEEIEAAIRRFHRDIAITPAMVAAGASVLKGNTTFRVLAEGQDRMVVGQIERIEEVLLNAMVKKILREALSTQTSQ